MKSGLRGVTSAIRKLNQTFKKIEKRSEQGMIAVVLKVKAEALKQTPIDTGNLRGSFETQVSKDGTIISYSAPTDVQSNSGAEPPTSQHGVQGMVKVGAEYALWVHEIPKNYTVGNHKYLYNALKSVDAAKILADWMKL